MINNKILTKCEGFSLVELAIVLVVIGLLVGGVLLGKELIKQSGIRAQAAQIESFSVAAVAFRLKYGEIPGDATRTKAAAFGFRSPHAAYTNIPNGNGQFDYITDQENQNCVVLTRLTKSLSILGESQFFFIHLLDAKFINSVSLTDYSGGTVYTGTHIPYAKVGGGIIVETLCSKSRNAFFIGYKDTGVAGNHDIGNKLTGMFDADWASSYDIKYDDGRPTEGAVISVNTSVRVNSGTSTDCSTSTLYNVSNTTKNCSLAITASF